MRRQAVLTSLAALAILSGPLALEVAASAGAAVATPTPAPSAFTDAASIDGVRAGRGTVPTTTVDENQRVDLSGGGFMPFSPVTVADHATPSDSGGSTVAPSVVSTVTADAGGDFEIVVSPTVVGTIDVVATGLGADGAAHTDTQTLTVVSSGAPVPKTRAGVSSMPRPTTRAGGGSKTNSAGPVVNGSAPATTDATASSTATASATSAATGGSTTGPTTASEAGSKVGTNTGILPKTGADDVTLEIWLSGGLLVAGGTVVLAISRRRPPVRP